jgi:hypothetical protein
MRPPGRDDILDGLALVQAAAEHDGEGARVILGYGDPERIAVFLAVVGRDLLQILADVTDEPPAELLAGLCTGYGSEL